MKIEENKNSLKLVDEISNIIDNHLNKLKKEEIQNYFGLKTEEEIKQLYDKTGINQNLNEINNNYPDEIIDKIAKNLPKRCLIGLPDKEYFISKLENNKFIKEDYLYQEFKKDGNDGYRCIALQLLGNEEFHNEIRMDVYNFLYNNKNTKILGIKLPPLYEK